MGDTIQEIENVAPVLVPTAMKLLSLFFPQLAPLWLMLSTAFSQVGSAQALIDHLDAAKPADPRLSA